MNRRHSRVTDWGLSRVTIGETDTVLDVGCGGGVTVAKLAATAARGTVHGVDYSTECVAAAWRANHRLVESGRVGISKASVSALPFPDATFDLVTAVETHFWWEDLGGGIREIYRVLDPGGRFLVVAEFYNGGKHAKYAKILADVTGMATLDVDQHRAMLADAGFTDVRVVEDPTKGWLAAVGTKPSDEGA